MRKWDLTTTATTITSDSSDAGGEARSRKVPTGEIHRKGACGVFGWFSRRPWERGEVPTVSCEA